MCQTLVSTHIYCSTIVWFIALDRTIVARTYRLSGLNAAASLEFDGAVALSL
jgi:hypothetical protein